MKLCSRLRNLVNLRRHWRKLNSRWKTYLKLAGFLFVIIVFFAVLFFAVDGSLTSDQFADSKWYTQDRFFDCLYFSVITITTLGYGDIAPVEYGKLFASLETIMGIIFAGYAVSEISRLVQEDRTAKRIVEKLRSEFRPVESSLRNVSLNCSTLPFTGPITQPEAIQAALELEQSVSAFVKARKEFTEHPLQSVLLDSPVANLNRRLKLVENSCFLGPETTAQMLLLFGNDGWSIPDAAEREFGLKLDRSKPTTEWMPDVLSEIRKRNFSVVAEITQALKVAEKFAFVRSD